MCLENLFQMIGCTSVQVQKVEIKFSTVHALSSLYLPSGVNGDIGGGDGETCIGSLKS